MHLTDVSTVEKPNLEKKKRNAAIANVVLSAVKEIWEKNSSPMRTEKAMFSLIQNLIKRVDFVKINVRRHENDANWIEDVVKGHDKVFDLSEKQPVLGNEPMDVDIEPGPSEIVENLGKRKRNVPDRFRDKDSQVNIIC